MTPTSCLWSTPLMTSPGVTACRWTTTKGGGDLPEKGRGRGVRSYNKPLENLEMWWGTRGGEIKGG